MGRRTASVASQGMPTHETGFRRSNPLLRVSVALSLALIAVLLWRFPPSQYAFYPQCPIYAAFSILCPGCGATRALAALLRGNLAEALRWNALVVYTLPASALYATCRWARSTPEMPSRQGRSVSPGLLGVAFGVVLVFTILRNI